MDANNAVVVNVPVNFGVVNSYSRGFWDVFEKYRIKFTPKNNDGNLIKGFSLIDVAKFVISYRASRNLKIPCWEFFKRIVEIGDEKSIPSNLIEATILLALYTSFDAYNASEGVKPVIGLKNDWQRVRDDLLVNPKSFGTEGVAIDPDGFYARIKERANNMKNLPREEYVAESMEILKLIVFFEGNDKFERISSSVECGNFPINNTLEAELCRRIFLLIELIRFTRTFEENQSLCKAVIPMDHRDFFRIIFYNYNVIPVGEARKVFDRTIFTERDCVGVVSPIVTVNSMEYFRMKIFNENWHFVQHFIICINAGLMRALGMDGGAIHSYIMDYLQENVLSFDDEQLMSDADKPKLINASNSEEDVEFLNTFHLVMFRATPNEYFKFIEFYNNRNDDFGNMLNFRMCGWVARAIAHGMRDGYLSVEDAIKIAKKLSGNFNDSVLVWLSIHEFLSNVYSIDTIHQIETNEVLAVMKEFSQKGEVLTGVRGVYEGYDVEVKRYVENDWINLSIMAMESVLANIQTNAHLENVDIAHELMQLMAMFCFIVSGRKGWSSYITGSPGSRRAILRHNMEYLMRYSIGFPCTISTWNLVYPFRGMIAIPGTLERGKTKAIYICDFINRSKQFLKKLSNGSFASNIVKLKSQTGQVDEGQVGEGGFGKSSTTPLPPKTTFGAPLLKQITTRVKAFFVPPKKTQSIMFKVLNLVLGNTQKNQNLDTANDSPLVQALHGEIIADSAIQSTLDTE